jgi:hypothetical protein
VLGDTNQYDDANTVTGGELVIPIERYAEKIAGTDFHQQLMPDIRLHMSDITANEAQPVTENLDVLVETNLEEAQARVAADESVAKISTDMSNTLRRFMGDSETARISTLEALKYQARGDVLGIDPMVLWERDAPQWRRLRPRVRRGARPATRSISIMARPALSPRFAVSRPALHS